jgi:hypothetical protein
MFYLDLLETRAGRDMYRMGQISIAKEIIVTTLKLRFGRLPRSVITKVRQIDQLRMLNKLHDDAMCCSTLDQFKEKLPGYLTQSTSEPQITQILSHFPWSRLKLDYPRRKPRCRSWFNLRNLRFKLGGVRRVSRGSNKGGQQNTFPPYMERYFEAYPEDLKRLSVPHTLLAEQLRQGMQQQTKKLLLRQL